MTSLILLLALTTPGQSDADEEKRQVYAIQLEHRLDGLDDRANHASAVYLDILARGGTARPGQARPVPRGISAAPRTTVSPSTATATSHTGSA